MSDIGAGAEPAESRHYARGRCVGARSRPWLARRPCACWVCGHLRTTRLGTGAGDSWGAGVRREWADHVALRGESMQGRNLECVRAHLLSRQPRLPSLVYTDGIQRKKEIPLPTEFTCLPYLDYHHNRRDSRPISAARQAVSGKPLPAEGDGIRLGGVMLCYAGWWLASSSTTTTTIPYLRTKSVEVPR